MEREYGFRLAKTGEVWSFTTVYEPAAGYEKYAPYTVAVVKLDDGPMVTAMLTDIDNKSIEVGMKVEMVTRVIREESEQGLIVYGVKFRPPII